MEDEDQVEETEAVKVEEEIESEVVDETKPEDESKEPPEVEAKAEDEDAVISFGDKDPDEESKEPAATWVKDLRKTNREQARKIADLEKSQVKTDVEEPLSARPTLEDSDYNEDAFADKLDAWNDDKRKRDDVKRSAEEQANKLSEQWAVRNQEYEVAKKAYNQETFEDAEDAIKVALNTTQRGILVHAFGPGAAKMIAGLGTNPAELKALADVKDPVLFAVEATRLESKMKVTSRKPKTNPETRVKGDASSAKGIDKLDKLYDADDLTAVMKEKAARRAKAEAA